MNPLLKNVNFLSVEAVSCYLAPAFCRRWNDVEPTLSQRLVFAGMMYVYLYGTATTPCSLKVLNVLSTVFF